MAMGDEHGMTNNKLSLMDDAEDQFKKIFKIYKSKEITANQLKIDSEEQSQNLISVSVPVCESRLKTSNLFRKLGLKPKSLWNIFKIKNKHSGLLVIRDPFTLLGKLQWVQKCAQQYSESPNKTNLYDLNVCSSWWKDVSDSLAMKEIPTLAKKLRWATLGFHHNWNTKVYDFEESSPMPLDVVELCQVLLSSVGITEGSNFQAEAAIINYYPPGTTLSPHTDHSEPNNKAPLVSLSFGRSAVFLIGGKSRSELPSPLFLHHGDVVIMAGDSRLSYHAVPRIFSDQDSRDFPESHSLVEFRERIATMIRVLEELRESREAESFLNLEKLAVIMEENGDEDLVRAAEESLDRSGKGVDCETLTALWTFIGNTRINMNIRQVHFNKS